MVKSKLKDIDLSIEDPLDINGAEPNFLNNKNYSSEYIELAKSWSKLPLYQNKDQIENFFNSIINNQVTLVISGTGSGKTVLIPKFLLKYFYLTNKGNDNPNFNSNIVITNPKILTTIYNAEYSAKTLDVLLGSYVGYKFRGSPENMVSKDTKLLYSTDGLLLSQIFRGDKLLSTIQGVIIDEAHERQVPIDLLLYFLKNVVKNRPEFKVIIMSATIDPKIFRNFYEKDGIKFGQVEISGQSNFPITSYYMKPEDKINFFTYMDVGLSIILKILEETKDGDILMFVTSQRETEIGCYKLRMLCPGRTIISDKCDSYYCAEVFGKMSDDKRELAVSKDKYKQGTNLKRKIIFATNVAESSITLDGIIYVVDCGLEYISFFDYKKYCNVLEKRYTTQAQIKQRMGRAGRTQPGVCYHLYTEDKFKKLDRFPSPAIALMNINEHFLSFLKYNVYLSDTIYLCKNLITPVTPWQLLSSIRYLHFYNLIKIVNLEQNGGKIKAIKIKKKKSSKSTSDYHRVLKLKRSSNESVSDSDTEILSSESEASVEESLNGTIVLGYKMIPYKNLEKYEYWDKYQGCLTRFGLLINELTGYPIELAMLSYYARFFSMPNLYSMVGIISAMDFKIDNIIKFPNNIQHKDKIKFINENFPDACVYFYSEHMFAYNILIQYYELDRNKHLLNTPVFERAYQVKNSFSKVLDRISDDVIDIINKKYNLVPSEINLDDLDILEKMYLSLFLAFRYNTIRLIDLQNIPVYQTQFYLENTSSKISFNYGKQIESSDANFYPWGICSNLSYMNNKVSMNQCTLLPESLTNKFINFII